MLPTDHELASLDSVDAIRDWAGMTPDVWTLFRRHNISSVRILACAPKETLQAVLSGLRIPGAASGAVKGAECS